MSALQIFDYDDQQVRVQVDATGEPWWVARDVCNVLDISNHSDAAGRLKADEKGVGKTETPGGVQKMLLVNEKGLYRLIFRSNKPEAEAFQDWVFGEVLPQIRRTGQYVAATETADPTPLTDAEAARLAERIIEHPDGRREIRRYSDRRATTKPEPVDHQRHLRELRATVADTPVDVLRERFHDHLRRALYRAAVDMTREQRAGVYRMTNRRLVDVVGKLREQWTRDDYRTAVRWLHEMQEIDLWQIFESEQEVA